MGEANFYYFTCLNHSPNLTDHNDNSQSCEMADFCKDRKATKASGASWDVKTVVKTAPFDARFPYQNQTRHCYQNYLDFHRCINIKGETHEPCCYFYDVYRSLCPNAWAGRWDDQRERGIFPGKI